MRLLPAPSAAAAGLLLALVGAIFSGSPLMAHAQPAPACPDLAVRMAAKPSIRAPGSLLFIKVRVVNTGATTLNDVGLRITVPLSVAYNKAAVWPRIKGGQGSSSPLFQAPQVYWPNFSLEPKKGRTFRLRGRVSTCQQAGTYTLQAAAYRPSTNCSTPAPKLVQVRVH